MAEKPGDCDQTAKTADTKQPSGIKRVRQACSNCRRKKVRCSGERPSCSFCVRLNQHCDYLRENVWDEGDPNSQAHVCTSGVNEDLLARVSSLEAKLTQLNQLNAFMPTLVQALGQPNALRRPSWEPPAETWSDRSHNSRSMGSTSPKSLLQSTFHDLPPASVIESACDTFFQYCHNQPYTFFHEGRFRQRLQERTWPDYLIFAFLSLAIRYSNDPWFEGNHAQAQDEYASRSWQLIVTSGCAVEEGADTAVVQAISLLAVVDSTAGRRRAAWVKIGLSIRLSQDLHLMMEPDPTLPIIEQEERRRLFWSIYLLDRFVSCSKQRPPVILDPDCQVQLPCDELDFRQGIACKTNTLTNLGTGAGDGPSTYRPGQFALLVLMVCVLGRCARYILDNRHSTGERAPFHPQSDYVTMSSVLLYYESFIDSGSEMQEIIRVSMLKPDGSVDQQLAGHMVLVRVLFHLCSCLLNHPFLLRERVIATQAKTPTPWLARSLETGLEHAGRLTKAYRDAKNAGCKVSGSFYGYCLLIAGTIHALYTHCPNPEVQQEAMENLVAEIGYLDEIARFWKNSTLIATGLRAFWAHSAKFSDLLNPQPLPYPYSGSDLHILWTSVDYGLMSGPDRPLSQNALAENSSPPAWGLSPWKDENEFDGSMAAPDYGLLLNNFENGCNTTNETSNRASAHQTSVNSAPFFLLNDGILDQSRPDTDFAVTNSNLFNANNDQPFRTGLTRTHSIT